MTNSNPKTPPKLSRRKFLLGLLASTATIGSCAGGGLYPWLIEPQWIRISRLTLALPRWPARLDGLTIAHLSDLHCGPYISAQHIGRVVAQTNHLQPDLVAITGDFASHDAAYIPICANELQALHARYGVFACLGNHDHRRGAETVVKSLQGVGITVLRNAALPVIEERETIWIAATDDMMVGMHDLDQALDAVPDDTPVILLAHEPDLADQTAQHAKRVILQLSGHSHGGQIRLPFIGAPILPRYAQRYPMGLYQVGKIHLYTNRGIGLIAPPVRFNCPPEIALLTLTST